MHAERLRLKRVVATSSLAGAAALLMAGSTAWACIGGGVASPFIDSPQPSRATAGSQVQVSGANWGARTVEIRWNGPGVPVLAQVTPAANGAFSRAVTIPSAATTGIFSMVAHQGDARSSPVTVEVVTAGAAPVGSSPAAPVTPGSPDGRTSGGSTAPAVANQPVPEQSVPDQPVPNQSAPSQPVPNQSAPSQPVPNQSAPSQPVPNQSAPSQSVTNGSPSRGAPSQAVASPGFVPAPNGTPTAAADQLATLPNGQAASTVPGAPAFITSGPQTSAAPEGAAPQAEATSAEQAAATPKNPSRDLWSGFADGQNRAADDIVTLPSTAGSSSTLPMGMAVLVGGLISLVAGFGLAELRRRRVTA